MNFLRFFGIVLFLVSSPARAKEAEDLDLLRGREAIRKILSLSRLDYDGIQKLQKLWKARCGEVSETVPCYIEECDFKKNSCKEGNVLLFRGESDLYDLTSTSALFRTRLTVSSYAKGLSVARTLDRYSEDLMELRKFEYAPQMEEPLLRVDSKTGEASWIWRKGRERLKSCDPLASPLSAAVTSYSFHTEASFPYFEDEILKKEIPIDPLISLTSHPGVAKGFTGVEDSHPESRPEGRFVVFSIPKNAFTPLCDPATELKPGQLLDPHGCKDPLNEHTEERELDLVLYPPPEWVYDAWILR